MLAEPFTTTLLPAEFVMRPVTMADLAAVTDLANACSMAQTGKVEYTADELEMFWQMPGFDMANSTRAVLSPSGQIIAYADIEDTAAVPVYPFVWHWVHPDYEGLGIGRALLEWGEERAWQVLDRVPAEARVAVRSACLSTYAPAHRRFAAQDFSLVRHYWRMVIELEEAPPTPQWPAGITVQTRQDRPDLLPIFRAVDDAFRDHWGHVDQPEAEAFEQFRHWVERDKEHDPSVWFLAMAGEEIAAVSLCSSVNHEDPDMGWVNRLAVRRPWRRQGLALALLHHSFGEFYHRGRKRVGLGVDADSLTGATKLYQKAGMHVARQYDSYEKVLRPGRDLSTQRVEM